MPANLRLKRTLFYITGGTIDTFTYSLHLNTTKMYELLSRSQPPVEMKKDHPQDGLSSFLGK